MIYFQAKEDGDKPGLEAMLQKVLQVYASKILAKRSYANKGEKTCNCFLLINFFRRKSYVRFSNCTISVGGEILIAEKFLEAVIQGNSPLCHINLDNN